VTWCQFAIRIASIRCCKTWLAHAASRAIWIVSMADEFTRKREPRNKAETAVAIVHSIKANAVCSVVRLRRILRQEAAPDVPNYGNYDERVDPGFVCRRRREGNGRLADWFRSRRATFVANHSQIIAVIALR